MDPKTLMGDQNKNRDLKTNKKITAIASSIEIIPSINEHYYRAVASDEQILNKEVSDIKIT